MKWTTLNSIRTAIKDPRTWRDVVRATSHEAEIGDGQISDNRFGQVHVARVSDQVRPLIESIRQSLRDATLVGVHMETPFGSNDIQAFAKFSIRVGSDTIHHRELVYLKGQFVEIVGPVKSLTLKAISPGRDVVKIVEESALGTIDPGNRGRVLELLEQQVSADLSSARARLLEEMKEKSKDISFRDRVMDEIRKSVSAHVRTVLGQLVGHVPVEMLHSAVDQLFVHDVLDD